MPDGEQRNSLIAAAASLMEEAERPEKITSRQIAARAGTNAAMINYYFGSKDALLAKAVEKILDAASGIFRYSPDSSDPPKERLRRILRQICGIVLKYRRYTKVYVPHLLLEAPIDLPQYILPEIREYFGGSRCEVAYRVAAYQMISFLQLAFYRSDEFLRYTGVDLSEKDACEQLIDWELEQFLPEGEPS